MLKILLKKRKIGFSFFLDKYVKWSVPVFKNFFCSSFCVVTFHTWDTLSSEFSFFESLFLVLSGSNHFKKIWFKLIGREKKIWLTQNFFFLMFFFEIMTTRKYSLVYHLKSMNDIFEPDFHSFAFKLKVSHLD